MELTASLCGGAALTLRGDGRSLSGWQSCTMRCDAAVRACGFPLRKFFCKRGGRKAGLTLVANHRTANETFPFYLFYENEEDGILLTAHPP